MTAEYHDDVIRLEQLEVQTHIGVPEDERASPQRLAFNLTLWPVRSSEELHDEIGRAVNYASVCAEVKKFVEQRRDRLIETLADALAAHLLEAFEDSTNHDRAPEVHFAGGRICFRNRDTRAFDYVTSAT